MSTSRDSAHVERQRRFYGSRSHAHLQAREEDYYSSKISERLADGVDLRPEERVLELGAGFGRFTFSLLERCGQVVALDLSQRSLESLARSRDERGVGEDRCRTVCADVDEFASRDADRERFDCIVGFFFLHHLPDFALTISRLAPLLAPDGRMAFVEPNRLNPLFAIQLSACSDMSWAEEKGLFSLSQRKVEAAYSQAALEPIATHRFGFFPPGLLNRSRLARRIESRLEAVHALRPVLPFLLFSARARAAASDVGTERSRPGEC